MGRLHLLPGESGTLAVQLRRRSRPGSARPRGTSETPSRSPERTSPPSPRCASTRRPLPSRSRAGPRSSRAPPPDRSRSPPRPGHHLHRRLRGPSTQDVSLVRQRTTITAIAGTRASLKPNAVTTGGFTGRTTPRVAGLPEGLRAALAPPALGPNASGFLTLTAAGAAAGAFPVVVLGTASSGGWPSRGRPESLEVMAGGPTAPASSCSWTAPTPPRMFYFGKPGGSTPSAPVRPLPR